MRVSVLLCFAIALLFLQVPTVISNVVTLSELYSLSSFPLISLYPEV